MSVKIYDREKGKWVIFPGSVGASGKDAYWIAQEHGYTGSRDEYTQVLLDIPRIINSIETKPTSGSSNLVTSGGVYDAISNVDGKINEEILAVREIIRQVTEFSRFQVVGALPVTGKNNIVYLKAVNKPDIDNYYEEFIWINESWEMIGTTKLDLSEYALKTDVNSVAGDLNTLRSTVNSIKNTDIANINNRITALSSRVGDNEEDISNLSSRISNLSNSISLINSDISSINSDINDLSNRVSTLETSGGGSGGSTGGSVAWSDITGKPSWIGNSKPSYSANEIDGLEAFVKGLDGWGSGGSGGGTGTLITVDSSFNINSTNPVQNKIITAEINKINEFIDGVKTTPTTYIDFTEVKNTLKTELSNTFVTKDELGSLGGGDITGSGNLVENNIILGAGTKSIKDSGKKLSDITSSITTLTETVTNHTTVINNFKDVNLSKYITEDNLATKLSGKTVNTLTVNTLTCQDASFTDLTINGIGISTFIKNLVDSPVYTKTTISPSDVSEEHPVCTYVMSASDAKTAAIDSSINKMSTMDTMLNQATSGMVVFCLLYADGNHFLNACNYV